MKLKTIDSYITSAIEESLKVTLQKKALQEKEKQSVANDAEGDSEKEKLKKGNIIVDDIIEKLNSIRSGKSFKEEEVKLALTNYFDGLKEPERVALLAFLKGISQIVTGEIEAKQAVEPGDTAPGIEMKKTSGSQNVSIKPNVIKAPDVEKSKKPSSEDTSGPVPITPKKK